MATAWKIHIEPQNTGLWKVKQTDEAAKKTTELLQQDLEARTYPDSCVKSDATRWRLMPKL